MAGFASSLALLDCSLEQLKIECASLDASIHLVALKTVQTILGNLISHPNDPKYSSLNLSNPNLQKRMSQFAGCVGILQSIGFEPEIEFDFGGIWKIPN